VTVLMSDRTIDCQAALGWVNPQMGAYEQVMAHPDRATLLSVSYHPGLKLGRISVVTSDLEALTDALCKGCISTVAYEGTGLKGRLKTGPPLSLNQAPLAIDVVFEIPRPAPLAPGEALPGGGEPGKAYLAYLQAQRDRDEAARRKLMPESKAGFGYGWRDDVPAGACARRSWTWRDDEALRAGPPPARGCEDTQVGVGVGGPEQRQLEPSRELAAAGRSIAARGVS
jgi:hypothetical protein